MTAGKPKGRPLHIQIQPLSVAVLSCANRLTHNGCSLGESHILKERRTDQGFSAFMPMYNYKCVSIQQHFGLF